VNNNVENATNEYLSQCHSCMIDDHLAMKRTIHLEIHVMFQRLLFHFDGLFNFQRHILCELSKKIWHYSICVWYEADSFQKIGTAKKSELAFISFMCLRDMHVC